MYKLITVTALLSVFIGNAWAETDAEKGKAIAIESDRRDTGFVDFTVQMTMELINRKGVKSDRVMRQKIIEREGGDKSIVVFDFPRNVKGTALLTHSHIDDDDQWLFLPKVGRVKRISSSNKSGSFVGSEFAYEDMSSQEVEKYTDYLLLKTEPCGDLMCNVIQRRPVDEDNSGYSKQILWVDVDEYRVQTIQFFDFKKAHLKTLTFSGYQQYAGQFWRADKLAMVNHVTGKSTNLIMKDYQFKVGLKEVEFRKKSLARVR